MNIETRRAGEQDYPETEDMTREAFWDLFGSPACYPRFRFFKAEPFGITTPHGENLDAFMALELSPGVLDGVRGRCCEDRAFEVKPEELEHFDRRFPPQEKYKREGQLQ